jgi:hypothetical protein
MIATNILVVRCDGCGHMDIFNAEHKSDGSCQPKREDIDREEWAAVEKWCTDKAGGYRIHHYCKACYGKAKA